jgi:hypothetical protein
MRYVRRRERDLSSVITLAVSSAAYAKPASVRPKKKSNVVYLGSGRCAYKCDSTYDSRTYIYRTPYCPSWSLKEEFSNGITIYCTERAN